MKSSLLKKLKCLKMLDYFGVNAELRVNSKKNYKSKFGGAVFLLWISGMLSYILYSFVLWVKKENCVSYYSNQIVLPAPKINLKELKFMAAISLMYENYSIATYDFSEYLDYNFIYEITNDRDKVNKQREKIPVKNCSRSDFETIEDSTFDKLGMSDYLCPVSVDRTIEGLFTDSVYSVVKFVVSIKDNIMNNREKFDYLYQTLSKNILRINIYFTDTAVDVSNIHYPIISYVNNFFSFIDMMTYKRVHLEYMNSEFTDDNSMWFKSPQNINLIKYSHGREYLFGIPDRFNSPNEDSGKFITFYIRSYQSILSIKREYQKLSLFLASIFSVLSSTLLLLILIMRLINDYFLNQFLIFKTIFFKEDIIHNDKISKNLNLITQEVKKSLITNRFLINNVFETKKKPEKFQKLILKENENFPINNAHDASNTKKIQSVANINVNSEEHLKLSISNGNSNAESNNDEKKAFIYSNLNSSILNNNSNSDILEFNQKNKITNELTINNKVIRDNKIRNYLNAINKNFINNSDKIDFSNEEILCNNTNNNKLRKISINKCLIKKYKCKNIIYKPDEVLNEKILTFSGTKAPENSNIILINEPDSEFSITLKQEQKPKLNNKESLEVLKNNTNATCYNGEAKSSIYLRQKVKNKGADIELLSSINNEEVEDINKVTEIFNYNSCKKEEEYKEAGKAQNFHIDSKTFINKATNTTNYYNYNNNINANKHRGNRNNSEKINIDHTPSNVNLNKNNKFKSIFEAEEHHNESNVSNQDIMDFKEEYRSKFILRRSKTLKLNTCDIILNYLFCKMLRNKKIENHIFNEGNKKINYYLDVLTIIKKMQELELIKRIIFSNDQQVLINFLSKPLISVFDSNFSNYGANKNDFFSFEKLINIEKKISKDDLENIYLSYKRLLNEYNTHQTNLSLIKIFETKIKYLF